MIAKIVTDADSSVIPAPVLAAEPRITPWQALAWARDAHQLVAAGTWQQSDGTCLHYYRCKCQYSTGRHLNDLDAIRELDHHWTETEWGFLANLTGFIGELQQAAI